MGEDFGALPPPARRPGHIAMIMDGNGRWASARGMPRPMGHQAGSENFRTMTLFCRDIGVRQLTVYAFSTENWKRPVDEVRFIQSLLRKYLRECVEKIEIDKIRLRMLGDLSRLPRDILDLADECDRLSQRVDGMQANVCFNYGGRDEITRAVRRLCADAAAGKLRPEELSEQVFAGYLDTAGLPDPDLVIRTGGDSRISNFLLWQSAYAEWFFTKTLWPDFTREELCGILAEYAGRERRFGDVKALNPRRKR